MYNLVFEKVEGIDYEVAKRTRAFIEAWRDDPEAVRHNGFDKRYINDGVWVVKVMVKDPLIEEYNEKNRGSLS